MKKLIYILSVVFAVLLVQEAYDVYSSNKGTETIMLSEDKVEEAVAKVFENEGINSCKCDIEAFYFYGTMYLSEEDKRTVLDNLADKLGINNLYSYSENRNDNGSEAVLIKEGAFSTVTVKIITYEIPEKENVISLRQYVSVNMSILDSIKSGLYYKNKVGEILNEMTKELEQNDTVEIYGDDRILSLSIKGNTAGRISTEGQKTIAKEILDGLNAEVVFEYLPGEKSTVEGNDIAENAYSIYAYTKSLGEYMVIGNSKINVNIVYSYDEEHDITTLHVASPIVNYDY